MPSPPSFSSLVLALETRSLTVEVCRSARRRRTVSLSLVDQNRARLLAPLRLSGRAILDFLERRWGWIEKRLKARTLAPPPLPGLAEEEGALRVLWQGRALPARVERAAQALTVCRLSAPGFTIDLAHDTPATQASERAEAVQALRLWQRRETRRLVRESVALWARALDVAPRRVLLTSAQRRWGSCSARNDIRIHEKLALTPPELLDYVVAHELCHIRHKNHGPRFWALLTRVLPDCRVRRRQLRQWEHLLDPRRTREQDGHTGLLA